MITNQYTVTKDLYLKWAKASRRKGLQLKITVMWVVILVILTAATIVYMLSPHGANAYPLLALELVLLMYCIFHLFFKWRVSASSMYDKMAVQLGHDWTRTVDFRDDAIYITDGTFEVNYPYKEIVSVRNSGTEIYLETDKKLVLHAYKDKFVQGDYQRFKRFIESKVVNRCMLS